jgi:spore maturation protein CgeB
MVKMSTSNSSLNRVISEQQFNEARAKTAVLYKLTMVMLRMGSFDNLFKFPLAGMNVIHSVNAKDINYSNPTGKDAEMVVKLGLSNTAVPNLSGYYEGQWVHYTPEMRLRLLKDSVLTAGMSLVRHSIYY